MVERRTQPQAEEEDEDNTCQPRPDGGDAKALRRSRSSPRSPRSTRSSARSRRTAWTRSRRARTSPPAEEKKYQKLREQLTAEVESVQFHDSKIETLVDALYAYNRRLTALGGQMLRLAERHRVPRKAFLESYMGHELDENWLDERLRAPTRNGPPSPPPRATRSSASAPRSPTSPSRPAPRSASSGASSTWSRRASARPASPRRKWSRPTSASSSPSPRNTPTAACSSSTSSRKATSA